MRLIGRDFKDPWLFLFDRYLNFMTDSDFPWFILIA